MASDITPTKIWSSLVARLLLNKRYASMQELCFEMGTQYRCISVCCIAIPLPFFIPPLDERVFPLPLFLEFSI